MRGKSGKRMRGGGLGGMGGGLGGEGRRRREGRGRMGGRKGEGVFRGEGRGGSRGKGFFSKRGRTFGREVEKGQRERITSIFSFFQIKRGGRRRRGGEKRGGGFGELKGQGREQ